jgi:hypothetical protein
LELLLLALELAVIALITKDPKLLLEPLEPLFILVLGPALLLEFLALNPLELLLLGPLEL